MEHSALAPPGRRASSSTRPRSTGSEILEFNATEMGFPGVAAIPVEWAIGARIDADWDSLDALRHTEDFQLPILLFHGTEDDVVPIETSDEFADELPRWVTYYRVPRAGHTQSWNVEPAALRASACADSCRKSLRQIGHRNSSEPDRGRARAANEEPAATYSPRGLPPKYHRRRVA